MLGPYHCHFSPALWEVALEVGGMGLKRKAGLWLISRSTSWQRVGGVERGWVAHVCEDGARAYQESEFPH
jgi:hypothetical protein